MILFAVAATLYAGLLILIRPAPASLRDTPPTYGENLQRICGSLVTGTGLMVVYLLTSRLTFLQPDPDLLQLLSLPSTRVSVQNSVFQAFTHLFIHANLVHLVANVSAIGLLSAYERRAGTRRFFAVLSIGCLASIPSILFYQEPARICGISGGVFALAAAFFTDETDLNVKEWMTSILIFVAFTALLTLGDIFGSRGNTMQVDHAGHALGALGGILYCRLRPTPARQPA